jgi:hypothetical protein
LVRTIRSGAFLGRRGRKLTLLLLPAAGLPLGRPHLRGELAHPGQATVGLEGPRRVEEDLSMLGLDLVLLDDRLVEVALRLLDLVERRLQLLGSGDRRGRGLLRIERIVLAGLEPQQRLQVLTTKALIQIERSGQPPARRGAHCRSDVVSYK